MHRVLAFVMVLAMLFAAGCGSGEVKPDPSLTPKVDQAEIEKKIQEGMAKGSGDRYKKYQATPTAPPTK